MPHSFGYRARTRDMFARPFRKQATHELSQKYFINYKVGDIVDIKCDGSVHRGMPHKYYHGRTGIVYTVNKRALGVEVNKIIRGKQLKKRVNLRVEHVRPSKCREDFLKRVKSVDEKKRAAKAKGEIVLTKRLPVLPREGATIKVTDNNRPITLYPSPYVPVVLQ